MNLGTGEALTSFLDEDGVPQIVQDTAIICPQSRMAPCEQSVREEIIRQSRFATKYNEPIDNESAYELLAREAARQAELEEIERQKAELAAEQARLEKEKEKLEKAKQKEEEKKEAEKKRKAERRKNKIESQLISTGGRLLRRGLLNILKF